jgi:hypothetical protein
MGEMRVADRTGDVLVQWKAIDGESTERAHKEWNELKKCGFEFYEPAKGDAPPKRVKQWNPDREVVLAMPGVQKPAERKTGERKEAMAGGPVAAVRTDEMIAR